ncbi:reverse transcriptase domain-containing protein [Tanacetum coccineum]
MVKKSDEGWRMCVDFTDINKACPKDCYPLPEIDWKIESLLGFRLKCFLDVYKGYHQIQIAEEDEDKTAFYAGEGVFCYKKMPFGLKKAGATYQRLVDKVFSHQIGRNLEAYVDDMVIKSTSKEEMLKDIQETFERFRSINMKLNPKKCSFGVEEGPFLGHLITKHGIKSNPLKVKAVIDLDHPRAQKDIQSLNENLAALSQFLSKGAERSLAFFKYSKGAKIKRAYSGQRRIQSIASKSKDSLENGNYKSSNIPGLQLLVNQIKGTFAAKQASIKEYLQKVKTTLKGFEDYTVEHVRRNQNKKADALSKLASMTFEHLIKEVLVEVLTKKSIEEKEVLKVDTQERKSWMDPIHEYLLSGLLPEDTREARKIRIQAPQYKLIRGNLYKREVAKAIQDCKKMQGTIRNKEGWNKRSHSSREHVAF